MKGNLLSFPFICFSESGLFKGLRQKKQKKLLHARNPLWLQIRHALPVRACAGLASELAPVKLVTAGMITVISYLRK
jgi:hypothetical protein